MMKESAFWARAFFSSFLEGSSCIHNFLCLAMWSKTFYYLLIVVVFYIIFFIPFWILILFRREATSTDYCVRPSKRPLCSFWARFFFTFFREGSSCIHNFLCHTMWSKTFYYLLIVLVFYIIFFIPFWILLLLRREATSTDYCVRPSKRPLCT